MASVLPVTAALLVFETLGYRSYRDARGRLHEARAQHLAIMLSDLVRQELESIEDWTALSQLAQIISRATESTKTESPEEIKTCGGRYRVALAGFGSRRSVGKRNSHERDRRATLAFRTLHPVFAEIFVTDINGRLLASTDKTSDYWQADENWWQRGFSLPLRSHYVEGIQYDESARVFSLDAVMPIRDRTKPDAPLLGVLKAVIDVTPLFNQSDSTMNGEVGLRQVVLEDGRVLATLYATGAQPLKDRMPTAVQEQIIRTQTGWMIASVADKEKDLLGYAPLRISGKLVTGLQIAGGTPMYVVVTKAGFAGSGAGSPANRLMGLVGSVFLFAFIVAGYLVATRKLIAPIENLREAVRRIATR
jgi:hypothetical protein